ncbi:MAG: SRPBCC family protein [Hyphomonadaceae bacterium]|nr:SRPBCC family protein [Hyphomonadaceae bacterium]
MTDASLDLEISRFVNAPRKKVWQAWTDPEILKLWWCPKPWVTEVRAFDLRPGGAFHTFMSGPLPDGTTGESDNPGVFLEIIPERKLVGTSMLTEGWRPATPWIGITSIFTMEDEGEGTRYVARCMHRNGDEAKKHEEMGFYDGWGTAITQLEEVARGL